MFYGFLFILLLVDQATKFVAASYFKEPFILHEWFRFVYAENTGIAFSFPLPLWVIIPASLIIVSFLVRELWRRKNIWTYGLIVIGALGNLIDRFWHGFVIDWISVWEFPIFNLADTYISLGLFFFVVLLLMKKA